MSSSHVQSCRSLGALEHKIGLLRLRAWGLESSEKFSEVRREKCSAQGGEGFGTVEKPVTH